MEKYEQLLKEYDKIPKKEYKRTFLEIIGYTHYENIHSDILAFYLDTKNEHGLGDLMLKSLIEATGKQFNNQFSSIEVIREKTTEKGGRIDIVITTDNYSIGIENKIYADLCNNLEDYYNTIKVDNKAVIGIVLSLKPENRESNFINITYEVLIQKIKKNIENYTNENNIKYVNYLMDAIQTIENLQNRIIMDNQLHSFFDKNRQSIMEFMYEYKCYTSNLYSKIDKLWQKVPKEQYAPNSSNIRIPIKYEAWREFAGIYVAFSYEYDIQNFHIAVVISIDPKEWKIFIMGRDKKSKGSITYLKNEMWKNFESLGNKKYKLDGEAIKINKDIIDINENIEVISKMFQEVLTDVEDFKKQVESKNNTQNS